MNFLDELRNLDINDIGRWPFSIRAIFIGLMSDSRSKQSTRPCQYASSFIFDA